MNKTAKKLNSVQREAKVLLAKVIIKNWDKATEQEKKEIERWWKENYGEFNQNNRSNEE